MAVSGDSKIIKPRFPSLSHLALVKTSVEYFFKEFDITLLRELLEAYTATRLGITTKINDGNQADHEQNRARKLFLFIPSHLRLSVLRTCLGIYRDFHEWGRHHLFGFNGDVTFMMRPDGSIHPTETVRNLVVNESLNIRERFHLACIYCLEDSVLVLWNKMEEYGEIRDFELDSKFMTNFWVRWIREGSRVPWLQAFKEYAASPPALSRGERLLCSPFFSLLEPSERQNILPYIDGNIYHDFLLCLYAASKEEEVKMLERNAFYFLFLYMHFPHQSFFIELAEKIWDFIDVDSFYDLLVELWDREENVRDFDYRQLFLEFWSISPVHLRDGIKLCSVKSNEIDSIFNKIRRKKKRNWITIKGRLVRLPRT